MSTWSDRGSVDIGDGRNTHVSLVFTSDKRKYYLSVKWFWRPAAPSASVIVDCGEPDTSWTFNMGDMPTCVNSTLRSISLSSKDLSGATKALVDIPRGMDIRVWQRAIIKAFSEWDMRLTWQPIPAAELAVLYPAAPASVPNEGAVSKGIEEGTWKAESTATYANVKRRRGSSKKSKVDMSNKALREVYEGMQTALLLEFGSDATVKLAPAERKKVWDKLVDWGWVACKTMWVGTV